MKSGQNSGTGAMTELDDEKVRKDDILSNREKTQRLPNQKLDRTGVQVDEYKDISTNQRPKQALAPKQNESATEKEKVDRPGFDLGGLTTTPQQGRG